jgi:hypothetical protein
VGRCGGAPVSTSARYVHEQGRSRFWSTPVGWSPRHRAGHATPREEQAPRRDLITCWSAQGLGRASSSSSFPCGRRQTPTRSSERELRRGAAAPVEQKLEPSIGAGGSRQQATLLGRRGRGGGEQRPASRSATARPVQASGEVLPIWSRTAPLPRRSTCGRPCNNQIVVAGSGSTGGKGGPRS